MSRPTFPHCILPVACIRAIVAEQKAYDDDPEEYERQERIRQEERELEQQRQYERKQMEWQEIRRRDG